MMNINTDKKNVVRAWEHPGVITFAQFLAKLTRGETGEHNHKCDKCGYLWAHEDSCLNDTPAHTCRKCGTEQWYVFEDERGEAEWHSCAAPGRGVK